MINNVNKIRKWKILEWELKNIQHKWRMYCDRNFGLVIPSDYKTQVMTKHHRGSFFGHPVFSTFGVRGDLYMESREDHAAAYVGAGVTWRWRHEAAIIIISHEQDARQRTTSAAAAAAAAGHIKVITDAFIRHMS